MASRTHKKSAVHSAPQRRKFHWRGGAAARFLAKIAVVGAGSLLIGHSAKAAGGNTIFNVVNGQTNLAASGTYTNASTPTVASDVTFTNVAYSPAAFTLSSSFTVGSLNDARNGTNLSISNTSGSAQNITLGGSGDLGDSVSGSNSSDLLYVASGGNLTITGGSVASALGLVLGQSGNFDIAGTATISSVISGSNFTLTKTGLGTMTLTGADTFGALGINGGTVNLNTGGSLASGTGVTFNSGGGILNINEVAGNSQTLGTVKFASGEGNIVSTYGSSGTTNLTLTNGSRSTGATRVFTLSGGTAGTAGNPGTAGTNNIILTGQATGFIDQGSFFGTSTTQPGSNYAWYDSGGFVRGINYGVDAGSTTQAGGATIASTAYAQTTASITAQQTATFTTLNLVNTTNVAQTFTLGAGQTVTTNGILRSGNGGTTGVTTITGGAGIQAGANQELVIRADATNDLLTINSTILANGTNTLTKSGLGTVQLGNQSTNSNTNNYTGGTVVDAGTLAFGGNGLLQNIPAVTPFGTGPIRLNGGTLSLLMSNNNASPFALTKVLNSVVMGGNATINVDRGGGGSGGNGAFQINSLDLGANTLTVNSGNGYDFGVGGVTKGVNGAAITDTGGAANNGLSSVNLNALTVSNAAAAGSTNYISLSVANVNVPINLYGRVTDNAADATKVLGLVFRDTNTTATNTNVLNLFGNNTFSGGLTAIGSGSSGIVRLYNTNALGTGNTSLNGAILEGTRDYTSFTQTLGTGAGQLQFSGGVANTGTNVASGFGAYGANVTVNLTPAGGSAGGTLVWNSTAGFNLGTGNLILNGNDTPAAGSAGSANDAAGGLGTLTFQNGLDLNGANRTIETDGGTAIISGNIINSGATAQLTKVGGNLGNGGIALGNASTGVLVLSGTNTFNGQININGGELSFATQANVGTGNIAFAGGGLQYTGSGALTLTNTYSTGNNNLGFDITNAAGSLTVASNLSTGGSSFLKFGAGTLNYSGNNFNVANIFVGGTSQLANATNGTTNLTTAAPAGNLSAALQITNGTVNFASSASATPLFNFTGALTFNRAATIGVNKGTNTTETVNFATNNFTRNAAGSTLTFAPNGGFATFGTSEKVTVGSTPTLNSNAAAVGTLNPSIIVRDTAANNLNADFVSIATGGTTLFNANSASATAVSKDTTTANGVTFNTANPGVTKLEYVNSGVTVSGQTTATVGALVNAGAVTIANANTLTIGNNTANNQAGLILNGGTISGGTVAFGLDEGVIAFNSQTTDAITSVVTGTGGMTFNGATGGTLTLGSATANTYSGTNTINGGTIKLAATSTNALGAANNGLTINSGTLDLNGNSPANAVGILNGTSLATITNSGTGASVLTIGGNNTNNGLYSGAITDSGTGKTLGITKTGSGTMSLLGTDTYTGTTTISGGALQANDGAGLSSTSALVLSGGVLQSFGPATFTRALGTTAGSNVVQFTGGSTSGFAAEGGPLTVNIGGSGATLTWNSTANFLTTGNLVFGNTTGTMAQSDNKVTFANGLDINLGNRTITANTVNYNTSSGFNTGQYGLDSVLLSGNLTDALGSATVNADSLTLTGNINSTLIQLSGTASDLKNAKLNVAVGTTQFLSGANLTTKGSLNDTGKVIVDNGATVTFGGDNTTNNINYVGNNTTSQNTLQIDGGTANFNNSNTGGVGSGNGWLFAGANSNTTSGAINITAGALNVGTFLSLAGTPNATAGSAPTGNNSIFALNIDGGTVTIGGGTGSVGAGVNGALYLKGGASDTAATSGQAIVNLNGGTLSLTQIIMGGGAGSQSVVNFNGGTLQAKGSGQTYASFIAAPGAATGGQYVVGTGGAIIDSNSNAITVAAPLLGTSGDGGLTKNGTGTLTLTGANTYNGGTFINNGTLNVSADNNFGTAPATAAANVTFTGNSTLQFGGSFSPGATRSIAINTGVTGTIDTNNNSPIIAGAIGGAGGLTVTNSAGSNGSLTLSGANTYTGATTVANHGNLNLTGSLAATATTVQSGGTLTGAGTTSATGIDGGAVTVNGGGAITASAADSTKSLTMNGLTLGNASTYTAGQYGTLNFSLATGTNVEALNVGTFGSPTGALVLNSSGAYVAITGTATSGSTYDLINFGSQTGSGLFSLSSSTANVTSVNVGRQTYTLNDLTNMLTLSVTGAAVPNVAYFDGAVSNVWNDTTTSTTLVNWSLDKAGSLDAGNTPGAVTDVILNADTKTGTVSTTLGGNTTINSLSVNGNGTNTVGSGNTLTINALADSNSDSTNLVTGHTLGDAITVQSGANPFTFNAGLVMGNSGANQTYTNASGSLFTIGGNITGTATTGNTQTLNLVNSSTGGTTISGVISDVTAAGKVAVTVNNSGSGTTSLSGNNTFTGGLTLTAGTLSRSGGSSGNEFGQGNVTINGGTMDINGAVGLVLRNLSGAGGNITSNFSQTFSSLNLTNAANTTYGGTIDGNIGAGVTKSGAGTLALTGANSYTGGTNLNAGILQVAAANNLGATSSNLNFGGGTLQLTGSYATSRNCAGNSANAIIDTNGNTLTDSGVISTASGTTGLTKSGAGTLVLNRTETYNGITTINNGTVQLGASGVLPTNTLTGGSSLVLNSGGALDLNSKSISLTAAPTGTGGTVTNTQNGTTSTLTVGTGSFGSSLALNDTTGGGSGTGVLALVVTGNSVTLNNTASNYTGGTTINDGAVLNVSNTALGSGAVTLGSTVGGTTAVLNFNSNGVKFANNFVLNGGTVNNGNGNTVLGGTANTIAVNGATTLASNYGYGINAAFNNGNAGKALEVNGVLSGSAALTVNGLGNGFNEASGIWINNNANIYSGTVTVNANSGQGMALTIGGNTALQNATVNVVGVSGNPQTPYGLGFSGFSNTGVNGDFSTATAPVIGALSGNGNIALQTWQQTVSNSEGTGAPVALTTGGNNAPTIFSGVLSGTGSFTKTGSGAMTLSGVDTYTGSTTVSAGTLTVNGSLSTSSPVSVASGATLNGTGSVGNVTLTGGGKVGSTGTLTTAGLTASGTGNHVTTGTVKDDTTVNSSAGLTVDGGATLATNAVNVNTGGTFTVVGHVTTNGNANTNVADSGNIILGASQNLGGAATNVTLSGGTLTLSANSSEGTSKNGATVGTPEANGVGTTAATFGAGTLSVSSVGGNSFIDFGAGNSGEVFSFAGYDFNSAGSLYIENYTGNAFDPTTLAAATGGGTDQLFFGANNQYGDQQLLNVYFVAPSGQTGTYQAHLLSSGEVVAPEPSQWVSLGLGMLGLGGLALKARKRKAACAA